MDNQKYTVGTPGAPIGTQEIAKHLPDQAFAKFGIMQPDKLRQECKALGTAEYTVEGLIPSQSLGLLVGDSGLGKSPLLYQMALCVASGHKFLGRSVKPGRVLYMDCENSITQVGWIIDQLSMYLKLPANEYKDNLFLWNLNYESKESSLFNRITSVNPLLVILDPLNAFFTDIERENSKATEAFHQLREIMAVTHCAIIGIHHPRKPDNQGFTQALEGANLRTWFNEARGARVLVNGSDVRMGIDKSRLDLGGNSLILRGFTRVSGEFPAFNIRRVLDEDGEPAGYEPMSGEHLLANDDQRKAYSRLPDEFRTKLAMEVYGKQDQATQDFLVNCVEAGILRKTGRGQFAKIRSKEESLDIPMEVQSIAA